MNEARLKGQSWKKVFSTWMAFGIYPEARCFPTSVRFLVVSAEEDKCPNRRGFRKLGVPLSA